MEKLLTSLALVLLPLAACSGDVDAQGRTAETWSIEVVDDGSWFAAQRTFTDEAGEHHARIRVAPELPMVWRSSTTVFSRGSDSSTDTTTTFEPGSKEGLWVGGELVEVEGRALRVGDRPLGELPEGAQVEIRAEGVFVDGEPR